MYVTPTSAKPTNVAYERTNWGYTDFARNEFKTQYSVDPIDIQYQTLCGKTGANTGATK
jgi:hypothetical protein